MKDCCIRALGAHDEWCGIACEVTEALKIAVEKRHYDQNSARLVGEMLLIASMLASNLKGEDALSVAVKDLQGNASLVASADSAIHVKASASHPEGMPTAGRGIMQIVRDLGMKEPYSSSVSLDFSSFAGSVDAFFAQSDQILAKTKLHVSFDEAGNVKRAFGFLVQALPFASEETKEEVLRLFSSLPSMEALEFRNLGVEDMIPLLFGKLGERVVSRKDIEWRCSCSLERVRNTLLLLGQKELEDMANEGKTIHLDCNFCGKSYYFTVDDLRELALSIPKQKGDA